VGPNPVLALVLTIGDVSRFRRGKQVASYVGLIRWKETSGARQKVGAITKQGIRLLRSLVVEAAQIAVRYDPHFYREYQHGCHRMLPGSGIGIARCAEIPARGRHWGRAPLTQG
jgi:transposase